MKMLLFRDKSPLVTISSTREVLQDDILVTNRVSHLGQRIDIF